MNADLLRVGIQLNEVAVMDEFEDVPLDSVHHGQAYDHRCEHDDRFRLMKNDGGGQSPFLPKLVKTIDLDYGTSLSGLKCQNGACDATVLQGMSLLDHDTRLGVAEVKTHGSSRCEGYPASLSPDNATARIALDRCAHESSLP